MSGAASLKPRQQRAIVALLECETHDAAAERASIPGRTLRSWLRQPAFVAELGRQRTRLLDSAATTLARGASRAAGALVAMAGGEQPPTAARVAACRAALEMAAAYDERAALVSRIEELETRLSPLVTT